MRIVLSGIGGRSVIATRTGIAEVIKMKTSTEPFGESSSPQFSALRQRRGAIWIALTVLLITAAISQAADRGRRPNVVLLMTDNQGAWTLGCYGNREIKTPNIDRMAAEGMLFTRAYCTHSLCSPSRATFLTG